jgi:hypothetical protein
MCVFDAYGGMLSPKLGIASAFHPTFRYLRARARVLQRHPPIHAVLVRGSLGRFLAILVLRCQLVRQMMAGLLTVFGLAEGTIKQIRWGAAVGLPASESLLYVDALQFTSI